MKTTPHVEKDQNLFGRYSDKAKAAEETRKLLHLFTLNGWEILPFFKGSWHLQHPHCMEHPERSYAMFYLCDNGGEMNFGMVNKEFVSVGSLKAFSRSHCNAETMHTRLLKAFDGEQVDYMHADEPIEDLLTIRA